MKAIRIHSYGTSEQMKLEEMPRPSIRGDEALVKIRAAGVNPVDWKIREGFLKNMMRASFPLTLGQDFAGDIVEVGKDVRGFKPGDKVFGFAAGSYAEFTTLAGQDLVRMPESVDYPTAASLPTAGLTAFQIIFDIVKAKRDLRILIHGAAGGVGSFAVQLARWKQARVYANAAGENASYLKSLGVERVVDYRTERFEDHLKDLDAVVDLVGGDTLDRSYAVVRGGGTIVSAVGEPNEEQLKSRGLRGVAFMMKKDPTQLAQLAALVDQRVIQPKISRVLPLSDAAHAHELNENGKSKGKIVLQVA